MYNKKYYIHRNSLKQHMQDNRITIVSLAESSGISITTIRQLRGHMQEPLPSTIQLLCKALRVDEAVLFPRKEIVGPSKSRCGRQYIKVGDRQ